MLTKLVFDFETMLVLDLPFADLFVHIFRRLVLDLFPDFLVNKLVLLTPRLFLLPKLPLDLFLKQAIDLSFDSRGIYLVLVFDYSLDLERILTSLFSFHFMVLVLDGVIWQDLAPDLSLRG